MSASRGDTMRCIERYQSRAIRYVSAAKTACRMFSCSPIQLEATASRASGRRMPEMMATTSPKSRAICVEGRERLS